MANRIRDVVISQSSARSASKRSVHVLVQVEELTPTTRIKGRLTGPRCVYTSTVEISFALQALERQRARFEMRVVIPEPSWWEPKTPFLYKGPIELWQDGQLCERVQISHGIRRLQLLIERLAAQRSPVHAARPDLVEPTWSAADAMTLRAAGINTVVMAARRSQATAAWTAADRARLSVIGSARTDPGVFLAMPQRADQPSRHLRLIFNRAPDLAQRARAATGARHVLRRQHVRAEPARGTPTFMVCLEAELAWLDDLESCRRS